MSQQQRKDYRTFNDYLKSIKQDAEFQKARYEAMHYAIEGDKIKDEYFALIDKQEALKQAVVDNQEVPEEEVALEV